MPEQYDVFLCHNSKDKPKVIEIAQQLQQQGLKPWLDIWHLQPGLPWQRELEQQIKNIRASAVFVGSSDFGPWQEMEIEAYLRRFVKQGSPVIPVLLNDAPAKPELPIFLEGMTWVDFRHSEFNPMKQLIWGITGIRPQSQPIINEPPKNSILEQEEAVEVELKSEKGVDYTKLRDLLAAQKWKEADEETGKVMLQAAERESEEWLDVKDLNNFPCEDLRTINQLWLRFSEGMFGFSVQKEIYDSLKRTNDSNTEVWKKFNDRTGWINGEEWLGYSDLNFSVEAPQAHLPGFSIGAVWKIASLARRLEICNI